MSNPSPKRSSEDIELSLRKQGKDYCVSCRTSIHGYEVSPERFYRWMNDQEAPLCARCRTAKNLRKRNMMTLIFIVIVLLIAIKIISNR
jgi:hypothetical protein